MTGADVSSLQTFLAEDPSIYPQGLVTGYYGSLTAAAVSNFQARNNIAVVGVVGPITRAAINAQMSAGVSPAAQASVVGGVSASSVTSNSANIGWATDMPTTGKVYYSTIPFTLGEHANSVDVNGAVALDDTNFHISDTVHLTGLASNTTYFYLVYVTNQAGYVSISVPASFHTMN